MEAKSEEEPLNGPEFTFGILFVKRFWSLHRLLFPSWRSRNSILFVVLLLTEILEQYVGYNVGLVSGKFYKVLGEKDSDGFLHALLHSLLLILAITLVKTTRIYLTRLLEVGWRRSLTKRLHECYFEGFRFYLINVCGHSTDNSDQRLTADAALLCSAYGSIVAEVLISPLTIAYYSYDAFTRTGWVGPVGMFAFFAMSTVVNKVLMSPVVRLAAERERREGDFRYKHVCTRISSEQIALSGPSLVEHSKSDLRLKRLCDVQRQVYNRQFFLDLATNGFAYISSIASFIVISIPIFAGVYDDMKGRVSDLAKAISENAFVCINLIYQFSKLVGLSDEVSGMAGVTHRVAELVENLSKMPGSTYDHSNRSNSEPSQVEIDIVGSRSANIVTHPPANIDHSIVAFSIQNVSFGPPGSTQLLVKDINLEIKLGRNLLITGQSGSGKSSLLRVLRGIWQIQQGEIIDRKNLVRGCMFFSQKIYLTDGSLRDQIVYPNQTTTSALTDDEAQRMLDWIKELGLGSIFLRCSGSLDVDPLWNWQESLSPGEVQRLAFVRLFHHRPSMAFLDEMTSALSLDVEEQVMRKCAELGITLVSVGHRDSLKRFHKDHLRLGLVDGGWEVDSFD